MAKERDSGPESVAAQRSGSEIATAICGLGALAAASALLLGWIGGVEVLLRPGPGAAPITPAAALVLGLLFLAALPRLRSPDGMRTAWALILVCGGLSVLSLADGVLRRPAPAETLAAGGPPLVSMSISAAVLALLACTALAASVSKRRRIATNIAALGLSAALTLTAVQIFQMAGPTMLPHLDRLAVYATALFAALFAALLVDP